MASDPPAAASPPEFASLLSWLAAQPAQLVLSGPNATALPVMKSALRALVQLDL
jgi:hypothetical protein